MEFGHYQQCPARTTKKHWNGFDLHYVNDDNGEAAAADTGSSDIVY